MEPNGKKSVKLDAALYRKLIEEAKGKKRTITGHLEDIIEKYFARKVKA